MSFNRRFCDNRRMNSDSINFCAFNERASRATNVSSKTNVNRERILNMLLENSVSKQIQEQSQIQNYQHMIKNYWIKHKIRKNTL